MKLMSIDCEMEQPSGKVIQIGAVAFDSVTGDTLDTLRIFVNTGEKLSDEIAILTGITQQQLDGGLSIGDAYEALKAFAENNKVFRNPVVWGAGASNDALAISRQAGIADNDSFMGHRVIDVKTLCVARTIMMKGDVKGGLMNYLNRMGKDWDLRHGQPHDALADAYNTAIAWMTYSEFMGAFTHIERYYVQLAKPNGPGKWQGIIARLDDDISEQIRALGQLQGLRDSLKIQG